MTSAAIEPYRQAKEWVHQYRDHGKVYTKDSEYAPKAPLAGLEQAVDHLKSAICQQAATKEKLTRLCWYLRNAAAQNGHDKLLARIQLFSVCLAKGLNNTRLLECELEGNSISLSSACFPLQNDFIQLLKELGRPIRIKNSPEIFHSSVFQEIASTLKTQEAYYPKKNDWQNRKVIASDALLFACHKLLADSLQGTLSDFQIAQLSLQADRLAESTQCIELSPWLTHMRLCLSKGITDPFLLSLSQETVIVIRADHFPLSEELVRNIGLLGYSVRVANSREIFAAPVFVQLANQLTNFEDFQEREHYWCSVSFKASRALLSLAEGLSGLTYMQGQAAEEANDANLEELQIALRYLATREESLIEDVIRFYLFANKYMIAPLQEACITKLVHLAHHDAPQTWPLAHYLSTVAAPKDAFTQVMGKGTVLKQSDFPLSPAFIQEVEQMDIAFIAVEDDEAIFSKKAFLKICQFETNLSFLDFCLMPCSRHGESFSIAPIISRLAGENLKEGFSYAEKDLLNIYQKLVDYLCTLETSRLVDLVVAARTHDIGAICPQTISSLARVLGCEANEIKLKMKIKEEILTWFQTEDSSLSFAQKLNRLFCDKIKIDNFTSFEIRTSDLDATFQWNGVDWYISTNTSITSRGFAMLEGLPIRSFYCHGHIEVDIFKRIVTPNLKNLYLVDEDVSIEIIKHMAKFPLETLTIDSVSVTDEWLEYISPTVRDLRISKANMTGSGLKHIQSLALEKLELNYIQSFEDFNLIYLRGMPLHYFSVCGTEGVTGAHFSYLKSARLKVARVGYSNIGNEAIHALAGMPIKEIDVSRMKITDQALEVMANMPLRKANLQKTKVTDKGIALLQSKKLEQLFLDETVVTEPLRQVFRKKGTRTYLNSQYDKGPEPQSNRREPELRPKKMSPQGDDEDCPCWVSLALLTAASVVGLIFLRR